jgi:molybdopterin synthase catalytic subunit
MAALTEGPIDLNQVFGEVLDAQAGAVVVFLGTVREFTGERKIVRLEFEAYREMAEKELTRLETQAIQQFGLCRSFIVHRMGALPVGEVIVAIAVSAPHRREAFQAAQWLLEELKRSVPIWKKEVTIDGVVTWVQGNNEASGRAEI